MSENYFYSSLSGNEIEATLLGAVRFNTDQYLTTSQKALARQNIGAGEADTRIKIKGFYDTLADLQQAIPVGNEGDVYAVGTASPYDLYIWDAVNNVWVNDGPISFSDAIIDDNDVSTTSVWSSSKTTNEIAEVSSDVDAVEGSLATYVRPNLLDNAYFAGGGSQLSTGTFPLNERGQTVYTVGYGINRWFNSSSPLQTTLKADCIELKRISDQYSPYFAQILNNAVVSGTYTLSFLYKASLAQGSKVDVTISAGSSRVLGFITESTNAWTLFSATFTASSSIQSVRIQFQNNTTQVNDTIELLAAKLERGGTQSLCHFEQGVPVLNECPDWEGNYLRCVSSFADADDTYSNKKISVLTKLEVTGESSYTLHVPAYSAHILSFGSSSLSRGAVLFVSEQSNGTLAVGEIFKGSSFTYSVSGSDLVIGNGATYKIHIDDRIIFGDAVTV